jgi:hypothetical protein
MKKFLIIAAAGAALAAGVPAALAATDNGQAPAATFQPVQQQEEQTPQPERSRPDRGDCPEKDGAGGGDASATATPEI